MGRLSRQERRCRSWYSPFDVRAQDQVNGFWHHNWAFGGDTTFYTGWADDPGTWTFGGFGQVPLNDNVALFGSTNYVISGESNSILGQIHETWNVSIGLVYYFGGKASNPSVSGYQGLPLLPVADNGTFAIQGPSNRSQTSPATCLPTNS